MSAVQDVSRTTGLQQPNICPDIPAYKSVLTKQACNSPTPPSRLHKSSLIPVRHSPLKCDSRSEGTETPTQSIQISDDSTATLVASSTSELNAASDHSTSDQLTLSIQSPIPASYIPKCIEVHSPSREYRQANHLRTKVTEIMRTCDVNSIPPKSCPSVVRKPVIFNGQTTNPGVHSCQAQDYSDSSSLYRQQNGRFNSVNKNQPHMNFSNNRLSVDNRSKERAPNGLDDVVTTVSQIPRLVNSTTPRNIRPTANLQVNKNPKPTPQTNPPTQCSTVPRIVHARPRVIAINGGSQVHGDQPHPQQQNQQKQQQAQQHQEQEHRQNRNTNPAHTDTIQTPVTVSKEFLIVNGHLRQEANDTPVVQEELDDTTINSDMSDFDDEKCQQDSVKPILVEPVQLNEIPPSTLTNSYAIDGNGLGYPDRMLHYVTKRKAKPASVPARAYAERNRQNRALLEEHRMNLGLANSYRETGWPGNTDQSFFDDVRQRGRYADHYKSSPNIHSLERNGPQHPMVIQRPRQLPLLDAHGRYIPSTPDLRLSGSTLAYSGRRPNLSERYLEEDYSDPEVGFHPPYPPPSSSSLGYYSQANMYPCPPVQEEFHESDPSIIRPRLPQFNNNISNRAALYKGRRMVQPFHVNPNGRRHSDAGGGILHSPEPFDQSLSHILNHPLSSPEKDVVDSDSSSTSENEDVRPIPRRMLSPDEYTQLHSRALRPTYHTVYRTSLARRRQMTHPKPTPLRNGQVADFAAPRWYQYGNNGSRNQRVVCVDDSLDDVRLDIEDPSFQARRKLASLGYTRMDGSSYNGRLSVEPVAVDSTAAIYNSMHADMRYPYDTFGPQLSPTAHNSRQPVPPHSSSSHKAKSECDLVAMRLDEEREIDLHPDSYIRNRPNYRLGFNGNYYPRTHIRTNTGSKPNIGIINNTNNSNVRGSREDSKSGRSISLERVSSRDWAEQSHSELSSLHSNSKNIQLEPSKTINSPPTSLSPASSSCTTLSKASGRGVPCSASSRLTVAWVEKTDRERQSDQKLFNMIQQLPPDRRHAVGFVLLLMGIGYNEQGSLCRGGLEYRLREALELVSPKQHNTAPVGGAGDCPRLRDGNPRSPTERQNGTSYSGFQDPRMTQSSYQNGNSIEPDANRQSSHKVVNTPQSNGQYNPKMTNSCTSIEDSSDAEQVRGESDDQPTDSVPSTATVLRRLARTLAVRIAFRQQHLADAQQKVARNETEEKWLRNKLNELFNPPDRFSFGSTTPTSNGQLTNLDDTTATQVITRFDRWHKNIVSVVQLLCQLARRLACVDARILSLQQNGFKRDGREQVQDSQYSIDFLNRQKDELEFKIKEAQGLRAGLENCRLRLLESIPPGLKVEDPAPELLHGYESTDSAIVLNEQENDSVNRRESTRSERTTKPIKQIAVFLRDRIAVHLLHTLQWLVTYHVLDTNIRVDQDLRDSVLDDLRLEMSY